MNKIYLVWHYYEEVGPFLNNILMSHLEAIFDNREDADEFVKRFEDPHVYCGETGPGLVCGILHVKEVGFTNRDILNMNPEEFEWVSKPDCTLDYSFRRCVKKLNRSTEVKIDE